MLIARVGQVGSNYDAALNGSNQLVITVGAAGVAAGSVVFGSILTQLTTSSITSISDSKGNTWATAVSLSSGAAGNGKTYIVYGRIATALVNGDTITVQFAGSSNTKAEFVAFSGLTTATDPLDKTASTNNVSGTSHTSGATAATTQPDELVVAVLGQIQSPTVTVTKDALYTQEYNIQSGLTGGMMVEYRIVAQTGAQTATATTNASQTSTMVAATFKGLNSVQQTMKVGIPFRPLVYS